MGTGVDVDKLDGFRPPVGDEKERYCNECIKKINSELVLITIWLVIISPVCILMLLSLTGYIIDETFVIDGKFMVLLLPVLCMSVVEYFLLSYMNSGKLKRKSLRKGDFLVLDWDFSMCDVSKDKFGNISFNLRSSTKDGNIIE